jgi:anhydro-N-acetylmuramic acid kinase
LLTGSIWTQNYKNPSILLNLHPVFLMMMEKKYSVLGMMSGTSLDGLDLVLAEFIRSNDKWRWTIRAAVTRPYPAHWTKALQEAPQRSGEFLMLLHKEYGRYLGEEAHAFLEECGERPVLVSSHGHTIFHRPEKGLTFQLGDGHELAAATGLPVVWDLRSGDVALGGQGAPLVPAGDRYLFGEYDYCLNLGGISNISYEKEGARIAYDISPVNLAMQHITRPMGMEYDKDGETGRKGKVNTPLLEEMDRLDYYRLPPPKSLGREWLEEVFIPLLDRADLSPEDKLRTLYEHISRHICRVIDNDPARKVLVTGGGAHNTFLTELLKNKCTAAIVIPEDQLVDYKEALIFAFLGLLRILGLPNTLASVTGAERDVCSGAVAELWNDER